MNNITEEMIETALDSIMDSNDPGVEALAKLTYDLKSQNEKLRLGLEAYSRERDRYKHNKPEISGVLFLSSGYGNIDDNQLPQFVEICPAYGCAWTQIYERTEKTRTYEGG